MDSTHLPEAFVQNIRRLLENQTDDFLSALAAQPVRGLALHKKEARPDDAQTSVPWSGNGYYIPFESADGRTLAHEAGAYYLQEPSAMLPVSLFSSFKKEARVLDLCAAPGGKSCNLAWRMEGKGLLVSNDISLSRAQVLSSNLERMGVLNALVTCASPDRLSRAWPQFFDKILLDAPCSGEGMFRKNQDAAREWTANAPAFCAERQRSILACAAELLRPGGELVYSTCTFNAAENEENVRWFLQTHPAFEAVTVHVQGAVCADNTARIWPHLAKGEGHFAALFLKTGEDASTPCRPVSLPLPDREEARTAQAWIKDLGMEDAPPLFAFGKTLTFAPDALPPLTGITVLRAGMHLGAARKGLFFPDHAFSRARLFRKRWDADEAQALSFLRGESLPCHEEMKGFLQIAFQGMPLGWGKASQGMIKNHYPKGLRTAFLRASSLGAQTDSVE